MIYALAKLIAVYQTGILNITHLEFGGTAPSMTLHHSANHKSELTKRDARTKTDEKERLSTLSQVFHKCAQLTSSFEIRKHVHDETQIG